MGTDLDFWMSAGEYILLEAPSSKTNLKYPMSK